MNNQALAIVAAPSRGGAPLIKALVMCLLGVMIAIGIAGRAHAQTVPTNVWYIDSGCNACGHHVYGTGSTPSAALTQIFPQINAATVPLGWTYYFDGCDAPVVQSPTRSTALCHSHDQNGSTDTGFATLTCAAGFMVTSASPAACVPASGVNPGVATVWFIDSECNACHHHVYGTGTTPAVAFAALFPQINAATVPLGWTYYNDGCDAPTVQSPTSAVAICHSHDQNGTPDSGPVTLTCPPGFIVTSASLPSCIRDPAVTPNVAPTVGITLPATGGVFAAPGEIPLAANAADSDGTVSQVQFFNGATLIGTGVSNGDGSYSLAWTGVAAGSYSLTAVATDDSGGTTTSAAVSVTVNPAAAGGTTGMFAVTVDHLGTPRLIEDQMQQPVWKWDQAEPFGDSVANSNPGSSGAFVFNLRFPGQYFDQETNTSYNYFRNYDPSTGRYIQSDPLGLGGGSLATYPYVLSNPLAAIDFFGLTIYRGPGNNYSDIPPPGPGCKVAKRAGDGTIIGWDDCPCSPNSGSSGGSGGYAPRPPYTGAYPSDDHCKFNGVDFCNPPPKNGDPGYPGGRPPPGYCPDGRPDYLGACDPKYQKDLAFAQCGMKAMGKAAGLEGTLMGSEHAAEAGITMTSRVLAQRVVPVVRVITIGDFIHEERDCYKEYTSD